jgi:hypothetical protein
MLLRLRRASKRNEGLLARERHFDPRAGRRLFAGEARNVRPAFFKENLAGHKPLFPSAFSLS